MKLTISPDIFTAFPRLYIGVAVVDSVVNSPSTPVVLSLLRNAELTIKEAIADTSTLSTFPDI